MRYTFATQSRSTLERQLRAAEDKLKNAKSDRERESLRLKINEIKGKMNK